MLSVLVELLLEVGPLLGYALISGVLTLLGLLTEYDGVRHLAAGDQVVGAWLAGFGVLLLYAGGYLLGYETVLPAALDRR